MNSFKTLHKGCTTVELATLILTPEEREGWVVREIWLAGKPLDVDTPVFIEYVERPA